jgi:hypothetical protein
LNFNGLHGVISQKIGLFGVGTVFPLTPEDGKKDFPERCAFEETLKTMDNVQKVALFLVVLPET